MCPRGIGSSVVDKGGEPQAVQRSPHIDVGKNQRNVLPCLQDVNGVSGIGHRHDLIASSSNFSLSKSRIGNSSSTIRTVGMATPRGATTASEQAPSGLVHSSADSKRGGPIAETISGGTL